MTRLRLLASLSASLLGAAFAAEQGAGPGAGAERLSAQALAVDPSGRQVALADGPQVVIWDRETLAPIRERPVAGVATAVAFQADGTLAALVRGSDGRSVLVRWGALELREPLAVGDGARCALAPDGSAAACASDRDATVIAPGARRPEAAVRWGPVPISALAISPGGKLLAVGNPAGSVRVFAVFGAAAATLEVGARPSALAFSRDGALLAVGGEDGVVRVWPTAALRGAPRLVGAHPAAERPGDLAVTALSFDARNGLASANAAEVRSFGHGSARPTPVAVAHATALALAGTELLLTGADRSLRAFDATSGAERLPAPRAPLAGWARRAPARWPDPWEAGEAAHFIDVDEDGAPDLLILGEEGGREFAWFLDLEGRWSRSAPPGDVDAVVSARRLRADAILLADDDTVFAWYDTASRGTADLVLIGDANTGAVKAGFRLGAGAPARMARRELPTRIADPSVFPDAARARRFATLARAAFGIWVPEERTTAKPEHSLPRKKP